MIEFLLNREADFSVSPTVDVPSRRQAVDFTLPVTGLTYIAIFRRPSFTTNKFGHLLPFQPALWLAVILWVVVMTTVVLIVTHAVSSERPCKKVLTIISTALNENMGDWILYGAGSISGQTHVVGESLPCSETFTLKWLVYMVAAAAVVLNAAYSGVLFSFLSLRQDSANFYHLTSTKYKFAVVENVRFSLDKRIEVVLRSILFGRKFAKMC